MNRDNTILFVGAGPGDPELITVAGKRALEEAGLVVYAGSLVSRDMLVWCREGADLVDSAGLDLLHIVETMLTAWRAGKKVVRLHTGDPSLYGAVAEQFRELDKAGAPYRVIPGVTAAFGAAAALGLEYTLPERCQTLILTRAAGRTPVPPGEDLASLASHGASLVLYLSAGQAAEVGRVLARAYGPEASIAVAYRVSWPEERLLATTPARLADDLKKAGLTRQVLILAGPGVSAALEGGEAAASRLYDPGFSHGFRQGTE